MKLVIALYGRNSVKNFNKNCYTFTNESQMPWLKGEILLFIGEIENMRKQGVYVRKNNGNVYYGYSMDYFLDYSHILNRFLVEKMDDQLEKKVSCVRDDKLLELIENNKKRKSFESSM